MPITSNPFTYSLWVKIPSSRAFNSWVTVFQQGQSYQYSPILTAMIPDAGHYQFGGYTWTGGYSSISSPSMVCAKPNNWHHLVWTSSPEGNRKLYFDDVAVASTTGQAFGEQNSWLRLGGNIAENRYDAYAVDEFRVYNRALSVSEVADLFANQAPVPSNNANLGSLQLSAGTLNPVFTAATTAYDTVVPFATADITITPAVEDPTALARVRINGGAFVQVASGSTSAPLSLNPGGNIIEIQVTAEDGSTKIYQVSAVRRFPQVLVSENDIELLDGSAVPLDFGRATREKPSSKTLTLTNSGTDDLLVGAVTVDGANASSFTAGAPAPSVLSPGGSATFPATLRPRGEGLLVATIRIASNAPGSSGSFDVYCSGNGMCYTTDTDADGMNDAAEFNLSVFGFDWNNSQPAMVAALDAGANSAGLYKSTQVQELHLAAPMIARDPVSGAYVLRLRMEKSADLIHFTAFPLTPTGISVNPNGELEYRFNPSDESAFFRIGAN